MNLNHRITTALVGIFILLLGTVPLGAQRRMSLPEAIGTARSQSVAALEAKHAFVPREDATANNDIGIEQASPEAIRKALEKVRTMDWEPKNTFTGADLLRAGVSGGAAASQRRAQLGAILGVGYANAKTFLLRLNHYGVTREEFDRALAEIEG